MTHATRTVQRAEVSVARADARRAQRHYLDALIRADRAEAARLFQDLHRAERRVAVLTRRGGRR